MNEYLENNSKILYDTYTMLVNRNRYGVSSKKKHVKGTGFVDSLSNIFNSIKASAAPIFKSVRQLLLRMIKTSSRKPVLRSHW